jgi:hypothetical protein
MKEPLLQDHVPVRLGTLLRLAREGILQMSQKKASEIIFEPVGLDGREFLKEETLNAPAWATYELGTRLVTQEKALDLIEKLIYLFILGQQKGQLSSFEPHHLRKELRLLYHKEVFVNQLSKIIPINRAATEIIARRQKSVIEILPERVTDHTNTPEVEAIYLLDLWISGYQNEDFTSHFTDRLTLENRFIDCSLAKALEDSPGRIKQRFFKFYPKTRQFVKDALTSGLLFEHIGPAIDAIMALSSKVEIDSTLSTVTFIDGDHQITLPTVWTSEFERDQY